MVFFLGRAKLILALTEDFFQVGVFFLLLLQTYSELNLRIMFWVRSFCLDSWFSENAAVSVAHVKL